MDLEVFVTEGLGDASYLLGSGDEAVLVDPQRDAWRFLDAARRRGWRIQHVLETHAHNDYLSGALEIREATGAEIVAPALGGYAFPHRPAAAGETVVVGGLAIVARATPGHTFEHLAWEVRPAGGATAADGAAPALFTGGSLLVGGAGRTDLVGPEATDTLTRAQYRTLRSFDDLPDETLILPTHGGGSFCTVNPSGDGRTTTLGAERFANPALTAPDEAAFVRAQLQGLRRFPTYYAHMGPTNRAGPPLLGGLPEPRAVGPGETEHLVAGGARVVDARSRGEFAAGHLPGSLNIELGDALATYVGWLVPFGTPLVLVLPAPVDESRPEAATQLLRIGYDRVAGHLAGGVEAWVASGRPVRSYRVATMRDLLEAWRNHGPVPVLDVRQPAEWAEGALLEAGRTFVADLPSRLGTLRGQGPWWVLCASGQRASIGASVLDAAGIPAVLVGRGGMAEWLGRFESAGAAVVRGDS